jgi:5'-phosphate synthase pdxT subunit
MIMLAKSIADNQSGVKPLGLLDIDVLRNGYGRQLFSFERSLTAALHGTQTTLNATFIRAPKIVRLGAGLTVLAQLDGVPVLVTHGKLMVSSFHTELDDDTTLLRFFLKNCLAA